MKSMSRWLAAFFIVTTCMTPLSSWAGDRQLNMPEAYSPATSNAGRAAGGFFELIATVLLLGLMQGDNTDSDLTVAERHQKLKDNYMSPLPTFRLEGAYVKELNNQKPQGYNANVTVGYMPIAAEADFLHLYEGSALPNRSLVSAHGLLRSVWFYFMEMDLALGAKTIDGAGRSTGIEGGLPTYFFLGQHVVLDVKPYVATVNGTTTFDFSSGLSYRYKLGGVRGAYRYLDLGSEKLHGAQAGLFFQW